MFLIYPFTATCIDDKKRPIEIPADKWVKEGEPYTIIGSKTNSYRNNGFRTGRNSFR